MKSANTRLLTFLGTAAGLVLLGTGACSVSGDGLSTVSEDGMGAGATMDTANVPGGSGGAATAPATGGKDGSTGGTGGPPGMGGMKTGGSGGTPASGGAGGAGNVGGAVGTGGTAGMNVAGMAMGGMNVAGMAGQPGMGGRAPMTYETRSTRDRIACGDHTCEDNESCCINNGQAKCLSEGKTCEGTARSCDDGSDCSQSQVCCGAPVQGNYATICTSVFQCEDFPTAFVVCANSPQCGDNRVCCANTISDQTVGTCERSCRP